MYADAERSLNYLNVLPPVFRYPFANPTKPNTKMLPEQIRPFFIQFIDIYHTATTEHAIKSINKLEGTG